MDENIDILCEECEIHTEIINKAERNMIDENSLYDLAELFKVFGDSTRIRILYALFEAEMCVCDIAGLLNMNQSAISHQLRILRNMKLVKYNKVGRVAYYSLDDIHINNLFAEGLRHVEDK